MWRVQETITTTAAPGAIWKVWTDVAHWSTWNPAIAWSRIDGAFAVGTQGETKPMYGPLSKIVLTNVEPGRQFANRTILPLAKLDFVHEAVPTAGGTQLTHRAELSGPLSWFYAALFGRSLKMDLPAGVCNLVRMVEMAP